VGDKVLQGNGNEYGKANEFNVIFDDFIPLLYINSYRVNIQE